MRIENSDSPIVTVSHEQLRLLFERNENGLWQSALHADSVPLGAKKLGSAPPFQVSVAGKPYGRLSSMVSGYTSLPTEMRMEAFEERGNELFASYIHEQLGLVVEVHLEFIAGASVIRQRTLARNAGSEPVTLTHLSSASPQGIAIGGVLPWHHPEKIAVHYCRQAWNSEGQWRSAGLAELGVYPTSLHAVGASFHLASVGSQSTSRYAPMVVVEDKETGAVWFAQIETSSNWHLEIGYRGTEREGGALFLHADGADERYGGWHHTLAPGESVESVPVSYGCCEGRFEQAVRQFTLYRRNRLLPTLPNTHTFYPLVYNDYMNCLWANPTEENILRQVDAAAAFGAEMYCMDAGWFSGLTQDWWNGLGDWVPSNDRFGERGLQGIFEYIKSKNMGIGIWIEMEVCGEDAALARKPDDWFLRRHGRRAGGGPRMFLDFSNPEVRQYLMQVIDRLVGMGATLIRNDCNDCIGAGDDTDGQSSASGLLRNMRAFYEFIEEVKRRHPHILMENCSSGGLRADYGMLSRFHLHSTSDQEHYACNPSIISGLLAAVLPEQAEFWTYPYPLTFDRKDQPDHVLSSSYRESMADGEQTIFNMVNGLCGNMYLSGRIDAADERNRALILEGVQVYKQERGHIHRSFPIWPLGFHRIEDQTGWAAVGLTNESGNRTLLAVWRLGGAEPYQVMKLQGFAGAEARIRQLYPSDPSYAAEAAYNRFDGSVVFHFPNPYQARYFEVLRA
ncbi:glycoside hydrolase family 36 protein [Paenibacillus sp.]|uniref:glycoside hydrolase family 36 protein n=1 Tax=Paenibacillus sp. TaxID=58172 RepID=UPI002D64BF28|nr:alpha-galactosidase [Paenibacillus sp.]HZG58657.1 alpha-galactosidase [Paenibacillus sp.]